METVGIGQGHRGAEDPFLCPFQAGLSCCSWAGVTIQGFWLNWERCKGLGMVGLKGTSVECQIKLRRTLEVL